MFALVTEQQLVTYTTGVSYVSSTVPISHCQHQISLPKLFESKEKRINL